MCRIYFSLFKVWFFLKGHIKYHIKRLTNIIVPDKTHLKRDNAKEDSLFADINITLAELEALKNDRKLIENYQHYIIELEINYEKLRQESENKTKKIVSVSQEKEKIEQEKNKLSQEKNKLSQEKNKIEQEKEKIEKETNKLSQETNKLSQEINKLSQENKEILAQNFILNKKVKNALIAKNNLSALKNDIDNFLENDSTLKINKKAELKKISNGIKKEFNKIK
ncbi:hypothetical protein [Spiroplasma tabanidicola]|uniref:Uncharacterized protein n=1 Tax=Spiroplasma tabanidicola TaxID=324079 RepID=A0A6I6CB86_9MOLU|nr:hypothetical protein [Spiroplasma tabanidicola]QGS51438.1 hypothetical protein STABA_v1c00710 [Spiroplasma tabanidicola]